MIDVKRFRFVPFWRLYRWGFTRDLFGRACDECHNPSIYLTVPLVGWMYVFYRRQLNTTEHLGGFIWEGTPIGLVDPACPICTELIEFENAYRAETGRAPVWGTGVFA